MTRRKWLWAALLALPLAAAGGLVWAQSGGRGEQAPPAAGESYTCPVTGEELPCPRCCPLNEEK